MIRLSPISLMKLKMTKGVVSENRPAALTKKKNSGSSEGLKMREGFRKTSRELLTGLETIRRNQRRRLKRTERMRPLL